MVSRSQVSLLVLISLFSVTLTAKYNAETQRYIEAHNKFAEIYTSEKIADAVDELAQEVLKNVKFALESVPMTSEQLRNAVDTLNPVITRMALEYTLYQGARTDEHGNFSVHKEIEDLCYGNSYWRESLLDGNLKNKIWASVCYVFSGREVINNLLAKMKPLIFPHKVATPVLSQDTNTDVNTGVFDRHLSILISDTLRLFHETADSPGAKDIQPFILRDLDTMFLFLLARPCVLDYDYEKINPKPLYPRWTEVDAVENRSYGIAKKLSLRFRMQVARGIIDILCGKSYELYLAEEDQRQASLAAMVPHIENEPAAA